MIVVVGNLVWRPAEPAGPDGSAARIALAAAGRGARVEIVGRAGDDPTGDALLLALATAGVGHVAVLRDPARPTAVVASPVAPDSPADEDGAVGELGADAPVPATPVVVSAGPVLEPADVALGLRYLAEFDVLVIVGDVPRDAVPVAVEAAGYAGARLVLVVQPGTAAPDDLPPEATVLAAPDADPDGAFAALVGAYAAALDAGEAPAAAFATAAAGWEAVTG